MLVYGTLSLAAGVSTAFLPETLNRDLPDTVADVEDPSEEKKIEDDES